MVSDSAPPSPDGGGTTVRPFRIDVPRSDRDDLADRLARTRWADDLPGADPWARGVPATYVPTGVAVFPQDIAVRGRAEAADTITHWSEFDTGGHVAAMESPELLVADVREFFRTVR